MYTINAFAVDALLRTTLGQHSPTPADKFEGKKEEREKWKGRKRKGKVGEYTSAINSGDGFITCNECGH